MPLPFNPIEIATYFLIAVNFLAFALFGIDKARAENGGWRIREDTLLFVAFLGGLPGALAGRSAFRHKTRKRSFNQGLLGVALAQGIALVTVFFIMPAMMETPEERAARHAVERSVTYSGCNEVRAAGKAPLHRGEPGYRSNMDGDGDGTACEDY